MTFKICLPLAETADPVAPETERIGDTPVSGSETILLAEDNDQVRELAAAVLETGIEFLQKPFTLQSLAARVRQVLDDR